MNKKQAPLRICILESIYTKPGEPITFPTYIAPYLTQHLCETHPIGFETSREQVSALIDQGFDVFINLCDGAALSKSAGIEVVEILEQRGAAYTGANANFYEPTRQQMKDACAKRNVNVPAYAFAKTEDDALLAAKSLSFPMIVKPASGYGSVGVLKSSLVENLEQLKQECERIISKFGEALIEEFIAGREFTVLVAENPANASNPVVYEPIEFSFPEGESFKHYDLKWINYEGMSTRSILDKTLVRRLKSMSKALFLELKGRSYARCDIRMDAFNKLYMLEINPNCGIFYAPDDAGSADFILLNDPRGHKGFLESIIGAALKDAKLSKASNSKVLSTPV